MKYIKEYYLEPRFDKNAVVEVREDNDWIYEELYSYNIKVAIYKENKEYGSKIFRTFDKYSQKTLSHQEEFFKQKGLNEREIGRVMRHDLLIKNKGE